MASLCRYRDGKTCLSLASMRAMVLKATASEARPTRAAGPRPGEPPTTQAAMGNGSMLTAARQNERPS